MTSLQGISFVTLGVQDLERSAAFYRAMGLKPHPRSNNSTIFFQLQGQVLALYPRHLLAEDACIEVPGSGFGGITLARNVASGEAVSALLDRAVKAGGTLMRNASEPPWGGLRGYFADPDGHAWEVAWNPGMRRDDEGGAWLPE